MGFCQACGHATQIKTPAGDHIARQVCDQCGWVLYDNPKIVTACIATWQDKVLWIQRATEPKRGSWAIPSGYMETGETPEQSAARELFEETRAVIHPDALRLFLIGSLPSMNQVYLVYRGELSSPVFETTPEASQVALLNYAEAQFDHYAYPEVAEPIHRFYQDHQRGSYGVYTGQYIDGRHTLTQVN